MNWKRAIALLLLLLIAAAHPVSAEETPAIRSGDVLCFGEPDEACGFEGRWLVLDSGHTSMGTEGLFLLSLDLIGGDGGEPLLFRELEEDVSVSFSDRGERYAAAHPGVTAWQGSDLQRWCGRFLAEHFTEAEQEALLPTYKSDAGIAIPGFGVALPGAAGGTVDFDPAADILNGDRLFPLSAEEAVQEAYGLGENAARVALYRGAAAGYWLRSPHIDTFPLDVGFVFSFGAVMDYPVNAKSMFSMETYARPACNLSRGSISGLEPLTEADGRTVWRVSFQDGEPNRRPYNLALPDPGNVPDVVGFIQIALVAVPLLLILLVLLILWRIVRRVRKGR